MLDSDAMVLMVCGSLEKVRILFIVPHSPVIAAKKRVIIQREV